MNLKDNSRIMSLIKRIIKFNRSLKTMHVILMNFLSGVISVAKVGKSTLI